MSYLVLARKLRPLTFDDIVAQQHITDTLKKAIESDRIAHAYLFCGTRGTGKTTTARILAKALNCVEGPTSEPCLKCPNCIEIASSSSMDVLEIDAASNTGVDDIRNLRENVRYAPAASKYKIYIIDEVHRLSGAAFDALLKTLEEPPAHVVFIFATTEPHNLPPTILSRTQRYDFRRIPLPDLTESLRKAAQSEGISITDDALSLISRKGDGSLRDALSLFEQVMAYADTEITVDLISNALGLVDLGLLFDLTDAIHRHDTESVMRQVVSLIESGADVGQFLIDLQEHLRNLLVSRSLENHAKFLECSDLYIQKYDEQKEFFSESDILRMVRMISDLRQQLKDGAEPRIFLEMTLLRLARMDTTATLTEVLEKLDNLAGSGGGASNLSVAQSVNTSGEEKKTLRIDRKKTEPARSANGGSPEVNDSSWRSFLDTFNNTNGILSIMLKSGKPSVENGSTMSLRFPPETGIDAVMTSDKVRQLEKAIEGFYGKFLKLKIETDPNLKSGDARLTLDPRFDISPEDLFKNNPEIKGIVDRYKGKITSIKSINSKGEKDG